MKMEAACSFSKVVIIYQAVQRHISEGDNLPLIFWLGDSVTDPATDRPQERNFDIRQFSGQCVAESVRSYEIPVGH
jgi:hypothetical protein